MERRQITRSSCELPLNIVQVGSRSTSWFEQTLNISSNGGVCFHSRRRLIPGDKIFYILTLSEAESAQIKLTCSGIVVRCRPVSSGSPGVFEVAMTMERYRFTDPDLVALSAQVGTTDKAPDAELQDRALSEV